VHARGINIGAVQQVFVGRGVIGLDPVDQLILAKIPRRLGCGGGSCRGEDFGQRFGRIGERGGPDRVGGDRLGDERLCALPLENLRRQ
jgi:hypothetical protein